MSVKIFYFEQEGVILDSFGGEGWTFCDLKTEMPWPKKYVCLLNYFLRHMWYYFSYIVDDTYMYIITRGTRVKRHG